MRIPKRKAGKTPGRKAKAMAKFFRDQAQRDLVMAKAEGRYIATCRGCGSMGSCGCWSGIRRD